MAQTKPKVQRVRVEGPSGPIEVHPSLPKKFPDRYKPVPKSAPAATKPAKGAEKEG